MLLGRSGILGTASKAVSSFAAPQVALAQAPACVVKPELTEGPYFVDNQLDRSDIRSEPSDGSMREGVPLALAFNVSQVGNGTCAPLAGARIDVWHCDALGVYSGVSDNSFPSSTVGEKFLRGYQLTDAAGAAGFQTIYPGWYAGRAVHIHFKIRTTDVNGSAYEFTSQFFFDEAVTDQVHALQPYASKGQRNMLNSADGIYRSGGDQLLLTPLAVDDGYAASFAIGLDLSDLAVGAADGGLGGPGGFGGRGAPGGGRPGRP
jgi:protocatechuate 3,4-dioxygenase beta subunit